MASRADNRPAGRTPGEAVQFAAEIEAEVLIGMHNDLFDHSRIATGQQ
jgi:hypothetical protein